MVFRQPPLSPSRWHCQSCNESRRPCDDRLDQPRRDDAGLARRRPRDGAWHTLHACATATAYDALGRRYLPRCHSGHPIVQSHPSDRGSQVCHQPRRAHPARPSSYARARDRRPRSRARFCAPRQHMTPAGRDTADAGRPILPNTIRHSLYIYFITLHMLLQPPVTLLFGSPLCSSGYPRPPPPQRGGSVPSCAGDPPCWHAPRYNM